MANSGKPCEEPWISAHGGLTSMTAWLASSCEKSTPKRDGRRGLSAVKSARNSRSFYAAEASAAQAATSAQQSGTSTARLYGLTCTAPVKFTGYAAIRRDIENLAAAVTSARVDDVFMTAVSPATLQILPNEYYKSQDDYTWALAKAIREEYKAIVDAGFILQIDDPAFVDIYDWWFSLKGDLAGYRKWAAFQVDAVNHALEGIPEDRVRFH